MYATWADITGIVKAKELGGDRMEEFCPLLSLRQDVFLGSVRAGQAGFFPCQKELCAWWNGLVCGIASLKSWEP